MEKMKVLIADENSESRKMCKEALMRAGIRFVDEASNGEEALTYINRNHPDVVIADVWLSRLDGIGLIRQAMSLPYGQDKAPAFIIASLVTNQNIFVEAARAGAALCLPKPLDYTSLSEHVLSIYRGRADGSISVGAVSTTPPDIEAQVTKIIHQIGAAGLGKPGRAGHQSVPGHRHSRAHQGLSISAYRNPAHHPGQRYHQFRYKSTLPLCCKKILHDDLQSRTGDPPRDRSSMGQRRHRHPQFLFRLHHSKQPRQAHQQ